MRYDLSTHPILTDEELIRLAQAGDELAFAELMSRYSSRIWRVIIANSRQPRDAEEILMDVWRAVWENISKLRSIESFSGWLRRIAYNACKRYYASPHHSKGEIPSDSTDLRDRIDQGAVARFRETELYDAIREAVHHLPDKVRRVAVLYYLELWDVKEIHTELGLAIGTIKTKLRQTREFLREEFGVEPERGRIMPSNTDLTNYTPTRRGKVRDLYDLGDELLIVSTDRISAFDVVLPNGIPDKGKVLTGLSEFWFKYTESVADNHLISTDVEEYPQALQPDAEFLEGRSMLVRKADRVDVECVVRGYLAGSGWSSYQKTGEICGQKLPDGLQESDRLPELLFTPTTKAEQGEHDEPISIEEMRNEVGSELTDQLIETSFALFRAASEHAENAGIILCDTKFEFGQRDGKLIVIDEVFTPDSSRFWPADLYEPGQPQQSFDKQFVRDYLSEIGWSKQPPAPELPKEVISKTSEKYREAYRLIVGEEL